MVDEQYVRVRMRQMGLIGTAVGIALFGVAYMSWHNLFHVIFIPIAGLMGYFTPKLLMGYDEDD